MTQIYHSFQSAVCQLCNNFKVWSLYAQAFKSKRQVFLPGVPFTRYFDLKRFAFLLPFTFSFEQQFRCICHVITASRTAVYKGSGFHFQVCSFNLTELLMRSCLLHNESVSAFFSILQHFTAHCFCAKFFPLLSFTSFSCFAASELLSHFFLGFCFIRDYFFPRCCIRYWIKLNIKRQWRRRKVIVTRFT